MTHETRHPGAAARLFGIFFLLAFASYGYGSTLVASLADSPAGLAAIHADKTMLMVGIVLMATVHSFVAIGLPVLILPVLGRFNSHLAQGYLAAGIAATVTVVVGAVFLALLAPLSADFMASSGSDADTAARYATLAMLLKQGGFYSYQIGMSIWGLGGLLLCALLYVSRAVPRFLPVWGFAGYLVFIAGTLGELFGYPIGVQMSLTGAAFEITLSLWLIVRGFRAPATLALNA